MISALLKKEWMEFTRNYKLLIMSCIFLFFGFSSPLMAKFMPDILTNFLPKEVAESFPAPTAFDSWAQYFKNISQMGLFVNVLVFGSILSNERQSGTLIIFLTKGLKRPHVIYVKSIFSMAMWTIFYILAFVITYVYTAIYFDTSVISQLFLSVFLLWLFGIFILSVTILGNVLFQSYFSTLLFTAAIVVVLFIISIFPKLEKISIIRLANENNAILHGQFQLSDYSYPIALTILCCLIFHLIAVRLFNRKEI
ncbi:MAG: hypothetical protein KBT36_11495 [Kurthia sp.]|nr:hypothetical protein [Candidatus Kurthia equi]